MTKISDGGVGGLAWGLALQFFVAEAFAAAAVPGYSYAQNFISDLGAVGCAQVCSPRHVWMNASFVLQGALIFTGLAWGPRRPRLATAALGACALGAMVVGLAPEDAAPGWHYAGATANLVGCNVGMSLCGRVSLLERLGIVAGGVGLVACAALGLDAYGGLGVGTVERWAAYPFVLWLAANGLLKGDGGAPVSRAMNRRA